MPVIDYAEKYPEEQGQEEDKQKKDNSKLDELVKAVLNAAEAKTNTNEVILEQTPIDIEFSSESFTPKHDYEHSYGGPYGWKNKDLFNKPITFKSEKPNNPLYFTPEAPESYHAKKLEYTLNKKADLLTWNVSSGPKYSSGYIVKAWTTVKGEKLVLTINMSSEVIKETEIAIEALKTMVANELANAIIKREFGGGLK